MTSNSFLTSSRTQIAQGALVAALVLSGCSSAADDTAGQADLVGAPLLSDSSAEPAEAASTPSIPIPTTGSTSTDSAGTGSDETAEQTFTDDGLLLPADGESDVSVLVLGDGSRLGEGALVLAEWTITDLTTGEIVDSSADFGGAVEITVGHGMLPEIVDAAILEYPLGSTIRIVLGAGAEALPPHMDSSHLHEVVISTSDLDDDL